MEDHKIDQADEEQIDLLRLFQEFWGVFRGLFWLPVLLAILLGAVQGFRSWRSYTPRYSSSVTFTIQMSDWALTDIGGSTNYYDKTMAEQLSKTFPYLLQSELMQSMLRQEMGTAAVNGSITAQTVPNTNLFSLKVTSTKAQDAYDILNTVIEIYPRVADYVVGSTQMNLLTVPVVAEQPDHAFRPVRTICKGAALGAVLGMLIILAVAAARRSIREPEEIRRQLNQSCLGTLPQVSFKRRSGAADQTVSIRNRRISGAFQESVRSLRIKFLRESARYKAQVVMVTSTHPGEGKTTVAVNLALTLSQNGAKVILVDLDLRKPSVKKALGFQTPSLGVPELLERGEADGEKYLIPVEGTNLSLLAGDNAAADARQQISSQHLSALLNSLQQQADFIVLDTPPCRLVADSASIARTADCTVYVLRAGAAQVPHVLDSLQLLADSGTRIMGCVLNGVQGSHSGYGYGGAYGKYSRHHKEHEEKQA